MSHTEGLFLEVQVLSADGEPVEAEILGMLPDGVVTEEGAALVEGFFQPEPDQIYYISIGSVGEATGSYNLNVFAVPEILPIDPLPVEPLPTDAPFGEDIHGDTLDMATHLDADWHEVFSNIDSDTDKDVFFVSVAVVSYTHLTLPTICSV